MITSDWTRNEEDTKFTAEDMGIVYGETLVELSENFVEANMKEIFSFRYVDLWNLLEVTRSEPQRTQIRCPFCNDGVLELQVKKRVFCEEHNTHTGDAYAFGCSKKCKNVHFLYQTHTVFC